MNTYRISLCHFEVVGVMAYSKKILSLAIIPLLRDTASLHLCITYPHELLVVSSTKVSPVVGAYGLEVNAVDEISKDCVRRCESRPSSLDETKEAIETTQILIRQN